MIRTPTGMMAEADALALFEQVGFTPPPGYMCVGCMLCNACRRYAQEVQHRRLSAECKAETFVDAKWQRQKWTPERAAQEDCGSVPRL